MEQSETPVTRSSSPLIQPCSSIRRVFPFKRTPHRRRIDDVQPTSNIDSTESQEPKHPESASEGVSLPGLINKTWCVFYLSPLYGFSLDPQALKQYGRSLTTYFAQDRNKEITGDGNKKSCTFSVYKNIKVGDADPEAVQILVTGKPPNGKKVGPVLLTAILCGVDIEVDPCVGFKEHFVYYPIMIIKARIILSSQLCSWLESHFDCRIAPLRPTSMDLAWMVGMWSGNVTGRKSKPVELLYTVPEYCSGMTKITYTIDADDCKVLWDSIHTAESAEFTEEEVGTFMKSLEEHFYECFKVKLWKMQLTRIGTPLAYVGDGRLKIFSAKEALQVLRFMSILAVEQFQTLSNI
ncbi:centromere protein L-like [Pomacea canaliculata]|uniref:centromere protein L-like n=1 Tax=Pomacea canaliculata TaxID=400727 RepID=UPI000D737282|nr:centromere protein L-like [Pomacea canaliculata]XP_025115830.1 centromere protein L-like [Pomacea canaliculata]XP_025115832.1 centromere protein L-like [Pomacea canaliculata]XP_025115833.1 centromere protein L-like [Pomacea canaliculata]